MYAIVRIAGQQFKVEENQQLFVHRLEGKEDTKVNFDEVLLLSNNGNISVGDPVIKGAKVSAKILEHLKADKVIVFKKKRRKGYSVQNAHRQYMTKISIEKIFTKSGEEKVAAPAEKRLPETGKKTTEKKESVKAVTKAETQAKVPAKKTTKSKTTVSKKPEDRKSEGGKKQ